MTDRTDTTLTSTTKTMPAAAEEHERAKEPLPTRPPRKHPQGSTRTVLGRFPASHPRGSWPAEEFAAAHRTKGQTAHVVMHLPTDQYLVVADGAQ